MRRRALVVWSGVAVVLTALAALLFAPWLEVRREQSPDGAFTAVTRSQLIWALLPMMPGQGSDRPVYVTVYKGARACGTARIEPGWIARDEFSWDPARRRAAVKLSAEWDLDACTIEVLQ